jgi:hypothetical protein
VRNVLSALVLASSLGLGGCFVSSSVHPLFPPEAAEPVEGIEGFWVDSEGTRLEIRAGEANAYELRVWEKDKAPDERDAFELRFAHLNGRFYWDLVPREKAGSRLGILPVHVPARVHFDGATLGLDFLKESEITLSHTRVEDDVILTAGTDELQAFLEEHGWRDELWSETVTYRK